MSTLLSFFSLNSTPCIRAVVIGGMDTDEPFALTAGFAYAGHGNNAVRLGVAGEF